MTSRTELARDHHVSLRRQLAVGLEAAIRDGHLKSGASLPSTREMARRLGVHRSTVSAAYVRLRRHGWVTGAAGGRWSVRVSFAGPDQHVTRSNIARANVPVESLLGRMLAEARLAGISRDQALDQVASVVRGVAERRPPGYAEPLHLYETRPGLRRAISAELTNRLNVAVVAHARFPARLASRGQPIALRQELEPHVVRSWPDAVDLLPLRLCGGTRERGIVRRRVRRGLVTLVSVSDTIRSYATDFAAREYRSGISFAAMTPDHARKLWRAAMSSRLLLCDAPSEPHLPAVEVPAYVIQLIPTETIASLQAYLDTPIVPPEPGRRGT